MTNKRITIKDMAEILTHDKKRLTLFANGLKIDKTLPKYSRIVTEDHQDRYRRFGEVRLPDFPMEKIIEAANVTTDDGATEFNTVVSEQLLYDLRKLKGDSGFPSRFQFEGESEVNLTNNNYGIAPTAAPAELKTSIWRRVFKRRAKKSEEEPESGEEREETAVDVLQFFRNVKLALSGEQAYINRVRSYVNVIRMADESGQTALKEQLLRQLIIHRYESVLFSIGCVKAITEKQLVGFVKESERGLALTYVANYSRVIPPDVVAVKRELDKLEVFDNYAVLHYSPNAPAETQTEEEKQKELRRKQDPILFGIIEGSDKLYYVADWIDEYCDLQWTEIVDKLGGVELAKSEIKAEIGNGDIDRNLAL